MHIYYIPVLSVAVSTTVIRIWLNRATLQIIQPALLVKLFTSIMTENEKNVTLRK